MRSGGLSLRVCPLRSGRDGDGRRGGQPSEDSLAPPTKTCRSHDPQSIRASYQQRHIRDSYY
eukprot:4930701-Amphidinium_carterae.1